MPYDYKRKQACRQKSGDKGTYVTKKQGASSQKCWKSETAFDNSKKAQHARGLDEIDMDDRPEEGWFTFPEMADPIPAEIPEDAIRSSKNISLKNENSLRSYIKHIILKSQARE